MSKKSHVAGWTSESPTPAQLKEFFAQVKSGRITKDRLQGFLRGDGGEFLVTVDYEQSLKEMIKAGNYDWVNSDITADHFPDRGEGKMECSLVLVCFDRSMTSDSVLKELEARSLQPGNIRELLAFAASYPEKQREFPIIALGSIWTALDGIRRVPYLGGYVSEERDLSVVWFDYDWHANCRFLARRKSC